MDALPEDKKLWGVLMLTPLKGGTRFSLLVLFAVAACCPGA